MDVQELHLDQIGWNSDHQTAMQQMQLIVEAMNAPVPTRYSTKKKKNIKVKLRRMEHEEELRHLVELWKQSGPNLRKLFAQEPELAKYVEKPRMAFWPTNTGRGYLEWSPANPYDGSLPPEQVARGYFMALILNPYWESLGGPCPRCQSYFIKKTNRPRVYCSTECGSKTTSTIAMKTKRTAAHTEKVRDARALIQEWSKKKRKEDWKTWVARDVRFTTQWITRAVTNGDITPPPHAHARPARKP